MSTLTEKERQTIEELCKTELPERAYCIWRGAEILAELRKEEAPSKELAKSNTRVFGGSEDKPFWSDKPHSALIQRILKIREENNGESESVIAYKIAKLLTPDLLSSQMYQAGILEGKRHAGELMEAMKAIQKHCYGLDGVYCSIQNIAIKAIQNAEPK